MRHLYVYWLRETFPPDCPANGAVEFAEAADGNREARDFDGIPDLRLVFSAALDLNSALLVLHEEHFVGRNERDSSANLLRVPVVWSRRVREDFGKLRLWNVEERRRSVLRDLYVRSVACLKSHPEELCAEVEEAHGASRYLKLCVDCVRPGLGSAGDSGDEASVGRIEEERRAGLRLPGSVWSYYGFHEYAAERHARVVHRSPSEVGQACARGRGKRGLAYLADDVGLDSGGEGEAGCPAADLHDIALLQPV